MYLSIIKILFSFMAFGTIVLMTLTNTCAKFLPDFVPNLYLYGKFAYEKGSSLNIQVPKRWFQHFYIFASIWSLLGFGVMSHVYFYSSEASEVLINALDFFGGRNREAIVSTTGSFVAMVLFTIQCWKRLYETCCVSIFSDNKMDLGHYVVGFVHYFGAVVAILLEAPGLDKMSPVSAENNFPTVRLSLLSWKDVGATLVFLWACYQQLVSAFILANLRKNKKGTVVNHKHSIPRGGLFDWFSAPHLLCEILMYISLTIILLGNTTWIYILFWVLSNQVATALQTHWWYQSKFKNYPKNRYALIPFIL